MEPVVPFPHELHPVPTRHGGEGGISVPSSRPCWSCNRTRWSAADVVEQGAGGRGVRPEILPGDQLLGGGPQGQKPTAAQFQGLVHHFQSVDQHAAQTGIYWTKLA